MAIGAAVHGHLENYIPPDGGWGWVIVFASFVIHFIMDGIIYSLGTYLTAFTEDFHVSHGEASIVHSLLPAITLSTGPLASWFTNAYGCRLTTLIGSAIASFGFFLSFFVTKFYLLYATIGCIVGIGFGLVYVPAIVSVGYYFEKKRSLAIGIAVCGAGVGTFILSPVNRILEDAYGLRGAFLVKSAVVLNMFVCGLLIRPVAVEPSEIKKRRRSSVAAHKLATRGSHSTTTQCAPVVVVSNGNVKVDDESIVEPEPDCVSETDTAKNSVIAITITDPLAKTAKIADSLPAIHIKQVGRKMSSSLRISSHHNRPKHDNNENDGSNKNLLKIESDAAEMAQSMPMLTIGTNDMNISKSGADIIKPNAKIQSINSALDIMAHIRSLQSIPIYNINRNFEEEEEEEEDEKKDKDVAARATEKPRTDGLQQRIKSKFGRLTSDLDLSLFRNMVFIFFAISNFLTSLGFNTPFIYIVDQATLMKIDPKTADWVLSTIGISNTIGRVVLGLISDIKSINRLALYSTLLTLCGIFTVVEPYLAELYIGTTPFGFFVYAALFGLTSGGYVSLTSVLLVDLLGLDKLTNAFGILLVFQGIATLVGPPTVGILYDIFHSYTIPFFITGLLIGVSGFMCFFIPCLRTEPNNNSPQ